MAGRSFAGRVNHALCHNEIPLMKIRLILALSAYAALALLAGFTLHNREMRLAVWVLLGGLAIRTWIADLKQQ